MALRTPQALLVDFNGTLSDDESVLSEVYAEMASARGMSLGCMPWLSVHIMC